MSNLHRWSSLGALALASSAALAQTGTSYDLRGGWLPSTAQPYAGFNLGSSRYRLDCGPAGCDQPDLAGQAYVGAMFNRFLGAEIGYLHMGEAGRGGGDTRAQGFNLSLVGRAPIGWGLGVVGRVGTTWGRTRVDAPPGGGIATGRASGWGPSYGLGVDWAFTDKWSAVLDWQRHRFDFAGDDNAWVRSTSVGLKYRF
jgi:OOP family OmpA-OmpF porin